MNLRRLREAEGMTQLELAMRAGVDAAEISRLEQGRRDPKITTVVRLAAGLGVDAGELVRDLRLRPEA